MFLGSGGCCLFGVLVKIASMAARAIMLDSKTVGFAMYTTVGKCTRSYLGGFLFWSAKIKCTLQTICHHLSSFPTINELTEAHCSCNIYTALFQTPGTSHHHHATILSAQLSPLPMLAISQTTNMVIIVLYCITKFYLPSDITKACTPHLAPLSC